MSKFSDLPENTTPAGEDLIAIEQDSDGLNRKVQLDNLPIVSELASTAAGQGASKVAVEDAGGNFTSTNVEGALAELYAQMDGIDTWVPGTTYTELEDVILLGSNNKIYRCITTNSDAVFTPSNWQLINDKSYTIADDTATGSNASLTAPTTDIVRLTDGSLASIDTIPANVTGSPFWLINRTGSEIIINNETGTTAADRILTGSNQNMKVSDNASIQLIYDGTESRWQVSSGIDDANAQTIQGIDVSPTSPTDLQVLQYSNANTRWEPSTISVSSELQVADIRVNATQYTAGVVSSSSYKTQTLFSVEGPNSSFASVASNQLTLPIGKYIISVPVGGFNGPQWIDFRLWNDTTSLSAKEFTNVVFNNTSSASTFNTVSFTIELLATSDLEFQTKTTTPSGVEYIGQPIITKIG